MVNIVLTDLEAFRLSEILKSVSDSIEAFALLENRPINAIEELRICACAEIFNQTSEQLPPARHKHIAQQQAEYNKEFKEDQDRQSELN